MLKSQTLQFAENVNEENVAELLGDADGILVPGGFGDPWN
jgi:CTP synthase (UTP-ammonia lyase)